MKKKRTISKIINTILVSLIAIFISAIFLTYPIASRASFYTRAMTESEAATNPKVMYEPKRSDFPSLDNRQEISYYSNKRKIVGYLYEVDSPVGIVLACHGINTYADSYTTSYQNYFVNKGYDVLAIDMVGCGKSEGEGPYSLYESRYCIKDAISYVKENEKLKELPLFLIGHSWGAYGVVSATYDFEDSTINAVVALAGYNNPLKMMEYMALSNVSGILKITLPIFELSSKIYNADKQEFEATKAIKAKTNTQYILVHGTKDSTVPYDKISINDNIKEDEYNNVTLIKKEGFSHKIIYKSQGAVDYYSQMKANNISMEDCDFSKYNELDVEMFDRIDNIFRSTIK